MNRSKNILILHPNDDIPASRLGALIDALGKLGANVKVCKCDNRYDEILNEIEKVDTLFFWG